MKLRSNLAAEGIRLLQGAFVEGTLDEVQGRVLPVVREAMRVALGQC